MTEIVEIEVELLAFGNGEIRIVEVPFDEFNDTNDWDKLELIFRYGQNDFQSRQQPSVSVGDVIRLNGKRFQVVSSGFERKEERCDANARIGTGTGMCDQILNAHGQCPRASNHL